MDAHDAGQDSIVVYSCTELSACCPKTGGGVAASFAGTTCATAAAPTFVGPAPAGIFCGAVAGITVEYVGSKVGTWAGNEILGELDD